MDLTSIFKNLFYIKLTMKLIYRNLIYYNITQEKNSYNYAFIFLYKNASLNYCLYIYFLEKVNMYVWRIKIFLF